MFGYNLLNTGRLERWALKLQEYDFKIIHRPGKSNTVAGALSRRVYDEKVSASLNPQVNSVAIQTDVEPVTPQDQQTETKETRSEYIQVTLGYSKDNLTVAALDGVVEARNVDLTQVSDLQAKCPHFKDIYHYLKSKILPADEKRRTLVVAEAKHNSLEEGKLYHWFQRRCKNPEDGMKMIRQLALPQVLRKDALLSYQDSLAGGGRLGIEKVRTALYQKYYWPRMYHDIVKYVRSCARCQKAKRDYHPSNPPMAPLQLVDRFERWHIDILGPLNKTKEDMNTF